MDPGVALESVSRYTFGSMSLGGNLQSIMADVQVARAAMEAGVWFHTSRGYARGDTLVLNPGALRRARPPSLAVVQLDPLLVTIVPLA